jgi:hypothetical protein
MIKKVLEYLLENGEKHVWLVKKRVICSHEYITLIFLPQTSLQYLL